MSITADLVTIGEAIHDTVELSYSPDAEPGEEWCAHSWATSPAHFYAPTPEAAINAMLIVALESQTTTDNDDDDDDYYEEDDDR